MRFIKINHKEHNGSEQRVQRFYFYFKFNFIFISYLRLTTKDTMVYHKGHKVPFITRFIPCFKSVTLKLINNPNL